MARSRRSQVFVALAVLLAVMLACRSVPLQLPDPIVSTLGARENRTAILQGMTVHRWALDGEGDGFLIARMDRGHGYVAVVRVSYDDTSISIDYEDSSGLLCEPPQGPCETIHRAYNRWVAQLARDIRSEVRRRGISEALEGAPGDGRGGP